jgi:2,4-dienoyl-CoA reductase (NADPH2)
VPRAAFAWVTKKLKGEVAIPLCTTNRINVPEVAEQVLADGCADMVSMARPLLADPEFVNKAAAGRADEINTCIACNQACLDHVFQRKVASCLVNPRAAFETEIEIRRAERPKRFAVVGAGPAGLACATTLAERGHAVDLFEGAAEIGGQFNMAKRIPGKEEFDETLRYFRRRIEVTGVHLAVGRRVGAEELAAGRYDAVVLATGVTPRDPRIEGEEEFRATGKVISYVDLLLHGRSAGERVAVIGAGGIGFDVSEYLVSEGHSTTLDTEAWLREWGVADPAVARGGLGRPEITPPARQVYLLQRKAAPLGKGLGKTTGWIHRAQLKMKRVEMIGGVNYERIDARGLHVSFGEAREKPQLIEVDTIVLCAGQEPCRDLAGPLRAKGLDVHLIGGADVAAELDAKRAIEQGTRLAARL